MQYQLYSYCTIAIFLNSAKITLLLKKEGIL